MTPCCFSLDHYQNPYLMNQLLGNIYIYIYTYIQIYIIIIVIIIIVIIIERERERSSLIDLSIIEQDLPWSAAAPPHPPHPLFMDVYSSKFFHVLCFVCFHSSMHKSLFVVCSPAAATPPPHLPLPLRPTLPLSPLSPSLPLPLSLLSLSPPPPACPGRPRPRRRPGARPGARRAPARVFCCWFHYFM